MNPTPIIWLLRSYRAGENSQLQALADAVAATSGARLHSHQPDWGPRAGLIGLLRRASLAGLSSRGQQQLRQDHASQPPDLVITAGLRNEPVARWLQVQGARAVLVGRTWANLGHFDLLVTTPQYRLPTTPKILHNTTTLHGFSATGLAALAAQQPPPAALSRPITLVLVGGDAGPYALRSRGAAALLRCARDQASGGTLLVTTSSRTHSQAAAVLAASMQPPDQLHLWQASATDNPYHRWLSWADRILVTADSIAMVSEAVASGRPVHLFDPDHSTARDTTLTSTLYRLLQRLGPAKLSRDVGLVHQQLAAQGWLTGVDSGACRPRLDLARSALPATAARVAALLNPLPATEAPLSASAATPAPEH